MKKILLSLGVILLSASVTLAQDKKAAATTTPATTLKVADMAFTVDSHDFGTVPEGPTADFDFSFKNEGKEPIIISKAQPSCGCTVPSFSKEPVAPGATGNIHVTYNTKGRPNAFTKSITVTSNAGIKILTIKGTVEKAPATSVPENNSMIKTN